MKDNIGRGKLLFMFSHILAAQVIFLIQENGIYFCWGKNILGFSLAIVHNIPVRDVHSQDYFSFSITSFLPTPCALGR